MKLHEAHAGDLVAVVVDGDLVALRIGRVLGRTSTKRRAFVPTGVLVDRLELEMRTFRAIPFDARCEYEMGWLPPDTEVEALIAPVDFMRRCRYSRVAAAHDAATTSRGAGGNDVTFGVASNDALDPIARMQRDAARSDQKDIPF